MRPISYILLLNIFWSSCVSIQALKDPECVYGDPDDPDNRPGCKSECEVVCPKAAECAEGQKDCGGVKNGNPFCPHDRICVSDNCDCPSKGSDGEPCPEFCSIACAASEKWCEGGRDEKTCKKTDTCVQRGVDDAGEPCPGFCPVTCESDQLKCPVAKDENGCEQAPVCEDKGKDKEGADCPGACSVTCTEENVWCSGKVMDNGCKEADICVFKGKNNVDELCDGTCPVECPEDKMLCPENILENGCKATDQCRTKAKGLSGKFCPATSDSHQCPKTCAADEEKCPTFEDQEGCKGEALCVKKAIGTNNEVCPQHSVCHTPCKVNELLCAGGMDESTGCKEKDTCLPMPRNINGELCSINCPGECKENEIQCEGVTTEEGCKGPDICVKVGEKLQAPIPEEVGKPCPGYCPIHKCPEGQIKCPAQVDPCYLCKTEEVCRTAAKDIDGVFCGVESASHNCPTYCDETKGEVLCPAYDDEKGCKPKAQCMMRTTDNSGNYCPSHSVCPLTCGKTEMVCPNGMDLNGCKKADSCKPRGTNKDGNLCPVQCPPVCSDNQNMCYGDIMENGCNAPSVCVDIVLGNGGGHCRTVCPITCEAGKELVPGGKDDNGCPVEGSCKVPKTFSDWTNDGECDANHATLDCGPGTQKQKRSCTDGEVDKCAEAEETRTVSCSVAGSDLPACPVGTCPTGFQIKCISGACKCYGVLTDKMTWDDARTKCQSYSVQGGSYDLASLTTPAIDTFVATLITEKVWHGLSDKNAEGEWKFVDGTTYNFDLTTKYGWAANEPNDAGTGEDCGEMSMSSKKWNDIPCSATRQSVCEGPAYGCSCTDFINVNGYGDCGKTQADFGDLVTCYVNEPSSCSDLVVSTTDSHLHQSARACVKATNFFAMDGCSTNGDEDSTPQNFKGAESLAEVQCCSKDGTSCLRQNPDGGQCWSGDNDIEKVTWFEAYDICASAGMRLCKSQEELNQCCGSGCQYDFQPLWTNQAAGE